MIQEIHKLNDIKADNCIIYKHSITCSVSAHARQLVEAFAKKHDDIPVYMNIVQTDEQLKWDIADKYGVKHETPQIIVLKEGKVVASASHYHIENLDQYF